MPVLERPDSQSPRMPRVIPNAGTPSGAMLSMGQAGQPARPRRGARRAFSTMLGY